MVTKVSYLELLGGMALCIVLGANNLSACLGASIGARTLSYRHALVLATLGVLTGLLFEGYKLFNAITFGIIGASTPNFNLAVIVSATIIMSVVTYRRIPISLSQVAVGAAAGAAIGGGLSLNYSFTFFIVLSWLLTPFIGFILAMLITALTRRLSRNVKRVLTMNAVYGYLTIFGGTYTAYVLGANTLGLIVGLAGTPASEHFLTSILFGFATVVGMILFSKGTSRSVAEDIVGLSASGAFATQMGGALTVHGFTEFGLPVSVSQAVVGGIYGAALPRRLILRNDRLTREILLGWTAAPIAGAVLGYLVISIL